MAALTLTPFFCFGFLCVLVFVSADQKIITAESGQNVTLTCRALNYNIIVVEWSRAAVDKEYVFLYRDGQFVSEQQHPSFKNRVDLQDRQMKDGDVSVILKDVTINDEGTYECRIIQKGSRSLNLISTITLRVVAPPGPGGDTEDGGNEDGGNKDGGKEDGGNEDGGNKDGGKEDGGKEDGGKKDGGKKDGSVGLIIGLSVSALFLVAAAVGFLIYRKKHQVKMPQTVV